MIFWGVALLLVLCTLLFIVMPLISGKKQPVSCDESITQQHKASNLASFHEQQADIALRVANKTLSQQEADKLTVELEKKLLAELAIETPGLKPRSNPASFRMALCLSVLIPVVALAAYSQLGAQTELAVTQILKSPEASSEQVVASIEDWVNQQPENTQALYLLGSQYLSMGHLNEAVKVYRKLYTVSGPHPQVSAQLAQVLFLANEQSLSNEVRKLYQEALTMAPDNTTALGLKGIDAFEQEQYKEAVQAWQLALESEADPQARQALVSGIARARAMLGDDGVQVRVRVDIAPELQSLPADTRVIVFARESGTRSAPVAAVPVTIGELPREIVLNDSSAMMMGGRSLSDIKQLDIFARVTLSGDVMRSDYQAMVPGVSSADNELVKLEISPAG